MSAIVKERIKTFLILAVSFALLILFAMNQALAFPRIEDVVVGGVDFVNVEVEEAALKGSTKENKTIETKVQNESFIKELNEIEEGNEFKAKETIPARKLSDTKIINSKDLPQEELAEATDLPEK